MYVATMQRLNYTGERVEDTQFAVYVPDTYINLKEGHGHQI